MTTVGRCIAFIILFASILIPDSRFPIPDSRFPIPDSPQLLRSVIPKHQEFRAIKLY
ncbi:MAG: hypothetical protein F6K55_46185 [Moorea sp. SIO4A3]|nr:hypothetical protein [Moorena sp. SIO4A3]